MSIKTWPEQERPREKLLHAGAAALSDAELLAILLRVGTKGLSAVELGRELLQNFQSLGALFNAPLSEFKKHKGLGEATYTQFAAVQEIAKRILAEELNTPICLNSSQKVREYLRMHLGYKPIEVFLVLFLDNQNRVIGREEVAQGSVSQSAVYVREVVKKGLYRNASSLIVAHNHPGGSVMPSDDDILLTKHLYQALQLVDICLLDHFLVTAEHCLSFKENAWFS